MAQRAQMSRPQLLLARRNMHVTVTIHGRISRGGAVLLPTTTASAWGRSFAAAAARGAPRFRVPAHVAAFTVLLAPVFVYFAFYERFGDEQHLQEELRERYAEEIRAASSKNRHMAEFFQHTFRNPDGSADDKIEGLIKAGRGAKKRLHAVDESLYGTAEGATERQRTEQELQQKGKGRTANPTSSDKSAMDSGSKKPAKDSKRREKASTVRDDESRSAPLPVATDKPWASQVKAAAPYAGVALVAATVGFLARGGPSKRS